MFELADPAHSTATPSPTLPIFIHLSSTEMPTLSLSFPTPNVPAALASPITLRITVDKSAPEGLRVDVEGRGSEKLSSEKLSKVAAPSLDLGLIIRSISHQLT